MVESKEWNWKIVRGKEKKKWLSPSVESYYLIDRWKSQGKKIYLDLGCGLGRHTIMFAKHGFKTLAFDLSEVSIEKTKAYAAEERVKVEFALGDMLALPYKDESIDCIYAKDVVSHTDTEGVKKIISELFRILKKGGELYLTLCSRETWCFAQTDWPLIDENTKLKMQEGPEYQVPHFYVDYELIKRLFSEFEIIEVSQIEEFTENNKSLYTSKKYHVLVKKT